MRTPGFSAEASLQNGGNHYIALRGVARSDGAVLPWSLSKRMLSSLSGQADPQVFVRRGQARVPRPRG